MKKGKTSRIAGFPEAKITYGTVDSKNLKSVYLHLQSWVNPKDEYENWETTKFEIVNNAIVYPSKTIDFNDLPPFYNFHSLHLVKFTSVHFKNLFLRSVNEFFTYSLHLCKVVAGKGKIMAD